MRHRGGAFVRVSTEVEVEAVRDYRQRRFLREADLKAEDCDWMLLF